MRRDMSFWIGHLADGRIPRGRVGERVDTSPGRGIVDRMNKRSLAALTAGVVAAVGAPTALATPSGTQYGNAAADVSKETPKPTTTTAAPVAVKGATTGT